MTSLTKFYPVVRALLGDRQVKGMWNYPDPVVDSALKSTFMIGRGPEGYALDPNSTSITPDVASGDALAVIAYEAALMLISGEDGAISYRTRAIAVTDRIGMRKRDLMSDLRHRIYEIRDGSAIFTSTQSFIAFLANATASDGAGEGMVPALEFTQFDLNAGIPHLEI